MAKRSNNNRRTLNAARKGVLLPSLHPVACLLLPGNAHGPASDRRQALSLVELIAAVAIMAIVAAYVIPRVTTQTDNAKRHSCLANQGDIELQAKLWRRSKGAYPMANLGNIGSDVAYFPQGLPICPVDGTSYTIDTTSGLVVGHSH